MSLARIRATPTWVVVVAAVVMWSLSAFYIFYFGTHWHLDLQVYRAAGEALYHGGQPFKDFYTESHLPFTYPPFALLLLSPLSLGTLGLMEALWWVASGAALVFTLYRLLTVNTGVAPEAHGTAPSGLAMPKQRALAVAALMTATATLILEPVRSNMTYAQINLFLMLLVVVDLTSAQTKKTWWRGCLVGLAAAIKLTPLVYLAAFLVRRDWRSLARGAATFVVATALSWLVLSSDSTLYWFHEATDAQRTGPIAIVSNQSWNGLLRRPPFHWGHLTAVLWVFLIVGTVACGLFLAARLTAANRTAETIVALSLTELLVSPVSWTHHWSWLAIVPIAVVSL